MVLSLFRRQSLSPLGISIANYPVASPPTRTRFSPFKHFRVACFWTSKKASHNVFVHSPSISWDRIPLEEEMDETEEPDFENLFFIPVHRGNETEVVSPATTKITTTISIDACTIPLPPSTQAYSPPRLIRGSDLPPSAIRPSIRPLLCKKNLSPRSMRDPYRIQYEVHARPDLGSIEEDSDDSYQFDRFGSFSSTTSTMISESSSFGFEGGAGQISPSTTLNSLAEVDEDMICTESMPSGVGLGLDFDCGVNATDKLPTQPLRKSVPGTYTMSSPSTTLVDEDVDSCRFADAEDEALGRKQRVRATTLEPLVGIEDSTLSYIVSGGSLYADVFGELLNVKDLVPRTATSDAMIKSDAKPACITSWKPRPYSLRHELSTETLEALKGSTETFKMRRESGGRAKRRDGKVVPLVSQETQAPVKRAIRPLSMVAPSKDEWKTEQAKRLAAGWV